MTKRWLKVAGCVAGVALATACSGARLPTKPVGETLLTIRGQVKQGPYYLQRSDLARLPRAGFKARAPGGAGEARFDGVAMHRLLEFYLQPVDGADTLVFVTKDGAALVITGAIIHQYGPILADQIDGKPVPPQLAWPNLDQRGLDADPRAALWWSGPVEALEVMTWEKTWGRALRPPPGITDAARIGAGQYALRCAACHRLHGVGGQRGPALDGAVGRLGQGPFVDAVRRHPGWPARLGTELTSGDDVALQVASFLAASDQAGLPPAEESVKPPGQQPVRRPGY